MARKSVGQLGTKAGGRYSLAYAQCKRAHATSDQLIYTKLLRCFGMVAWALQLTSRKRGSTGREPVRHVEQQPVRNALKSTALKVDVRCVASGGQPARPVRLAPARTALFHASDFTIEPYIEELTARGIPASTPSFKSREDAFSAAPSARAFASVSSASSLAPSPPPGPLPPSTASGPHPRRTCAARSPRPACRRNADGHRLRGALSTVATRTRRRFGRAPLSPRTRSMDALGTGRARVRTVLEVQPCAVVPAPMP